MNLFDVTRSIEAPLISKPRKANDAEVNAYVQWIRQRRGLPDMGRTELHYTENRQGRRYERGHCIGATFGDYTSNANRREYEPGSYSVIMPGHDMHRAAVTFEALDEAGEVERTQTLPAEPKKGGLIWTREDVRKAHGRVAKPGKAKAAPIEADPIPVQVEPVDVIQAAEPVEICAPAAAESESAPVEAREGVESGEALSEAAKGFFVIDTAGLERAVAYHADYKAAMAARDLLEPEATYPGNRKTDGKIWRYMVTSETGPDDCRADLRAQTLRYHADIAGAATDQEPEAQICAIAEPEQAPESNDGQMSDPVADLAERVAALEARLEALAVETGPVAENTNNSSPEFIAAPSGEVARPARTAAHERAIRRAWAERKARRGAQGGMAIHMRRIEALEMELRLALNEQALDKEVLAEANSRAEHYYANWKEEARREGIQGGRRANSTLRARRMILAARHASTFERQRAAVLAAQLAKAQEDLAGAYSEAELQAAVAVERERAASLRADLETARAEGEGRADGAGVAAAQAAAQMARAIAAEEAVAAVRADLDKERAALAAVTARNARLLQSMADLTERVERAEAAIAA